MLTKAQITSASTTLDDTDIEMLVALFRISSRYKEYPEFFPDLESRLASVDGTIKAQQLNAVLDLIEDLGVGEVQIQGGDEGLRYSQTLEREALINYAMSVVYDQATFVPKPSSAYGVAVGQRDLVCPICSGYTHSGDCYPSWY